MTLSVRDSRTGEVAPLPVSGGRPLTIYVCGPTVYDRAHVGHGRTYLYFDILRRALHDAGTPTRLVMNITDYEDKVSARAAELGIGWRELARREERRFVLELDRLRIVPPDVRPRASDFVPAMIALARRLERTGRIRRTADTLLYVPPPPSGLNFAVGDDVASHAVPERGIPLPRAGAAREIVLWHRQVPPLAAWSSPWGRGAPGWHLECYTMAQRYLGIPAVLHGGGIDLIFPHHYAENEIALAVNGTLFAQRFLHMGFVTQLHRKMSKSRGNLVPLGDALEAWGADALRWYLLTPAYNARLEWNSSDICRAREEWEGVAARLRGLVPDGAGGTFPLRRIEALPDVVRDRIDRGFAVHDALRELRLFAATVGSAASGRAPRGTAPRVRRALRRLEALLGVSIVARPGTAS